MLKHLKYLTIICSLFVTVALSAQSVTEDLNLYAANLRPYFYNGEARDSYQLKGYKSFYISHFGRHGSRYLSGPKYTQPALDCFAAADAAGILTEQGVSLYNAMKIITQAQDGMYGELAPLGAKEHRAIASRMYEREKTVFSSRKRTRVRCVSSIFSRCIVSMANFTEELSSHAPLLNVTYAAGKKYNDEYINVHPNYPFKADAVKIVDELKNEYLEPEKFLSYYFTDVEKIKN